MFDEDFDYSLDGIEPFDLNSCKQSMGMDSEFNSMMASGLPSPNNRSVKNASPRMMNNVVDNANKRSSKFSRERRSGFVAFKGNYESNTYGVHSTKKNMMLNTDMIKIFADLKQKEKIFN